MSWIILRRLCEKVCIGSFDFQVKTTAVRAEI